MTASSIFLIALFLLVIILTTCVSCCPPAAYYADTVFQKYSKLEGFGAAIADNINKPTHTNTNPTKIAGFNGLFVSPDDTQTFDKFAKTEGSRDCKHSFGLTNSMGGLCLNPEQIELLRTRGGNMSEIPGSMNEI